ncbi:MAG: hypothetical protein KGI98_16830, partial [Euryarchaeota archaeon]|nr:hypothetical protein [Euryarchaeota archaeon]
MSSFRVDFDPRGVTDGLKLPVFLRKRIRRQLDYLRAAPYRSHPAVQVKEIAEVRGVWRFHTSKDVRVFYTVQGDLVWVLMIERSPGITRKTTG